MAYQDLQHLLLPHLRANPVRHNASPYKGQQAWRPISLNRVRQGLFRWGIYALLLLGTAWLTQSWTVGVLSGLFAWAVGQETP